MKCNCFGKQGQFESDQDFHEMGCPGCARDPAKFSTKTIAVNEDDFTILFAVAYIRVQTLDDSEQPLKDEFEKIITRNNLQKLKNLYKLRYYNGELV